MKEEALKLADDLEELHEQDLIDGVAHLSMPQASAMIRRLVEELDFLKDQISFYELKDLGNQTKPLSDDEVWDLFQKTQHNAMDFARAIEERHGIK